MSSPNLPITSETITGPMHVDLEHEVVQNVYAQPGTNPEVADTASQQTFSEYAHSRFDPRFDGTDPIIIEVPVEKPAHRVRRGEGWILGVTPRLSAAVFLATTVVANLSGNFSSLSADAKEVGAQLRYNAKQTVSKWLGRPTPTTTIETRTSGDTVILHQEYPQPVGKSVPDAASTQKLVEQIADAQNNGKTITSITVFAGSSDERGPDESTLQVPNAGNDELDTTRATDAANALEAKAKAAGVELPEIEIVSAESILSAQEVTDLKTEAAKHGLSLEEAITIFNDGGKLDADLQNLMQSKLGDARSVSVRVEMQGPDQVTEETVSLNEVAPENKDHDYDLYWGIPLPFARRRYLEKYLKPGIEEWERPGAEPDRRWVELYKEALQKDGSLPRDAWRFTRKYQLLAREDRIDNVLTQRYLDKDGKEQEMRVMFVDHDPTEETVAMYEQLLTDVSQMRDGKVAERWSAITVFPRSQVGLHPTGGRKDQHPEHHPSDIGLDIDKQAPRGVLGLATPSLGLIEVHMPEDPTAEEIKEYMGALWVSAHEFAGHGTDVTGKPTYLLPTGPKNSNHYIATNTWNNTAAAAFEALPDSDADGPRDFSVTRQVVTNRGETVTLDDEVSSGGSPEIGPVRGFFLRMLGVDLAAQAQVGIDSRLRESQEAVLNGRKPTKYSAGDEAELHAEVAAQAVSKARIPYEQSGLRVTPRHRDLAQGYSVDPGLKRDFEQHTGWSHETARPVDKSQFLYTLATDDPVLGAFIDEARRTPMPEDRITLLTGVASLEQ